MGVEMAVKPASEIANGHGEFVTQRLRDLAERVGLDGNMFFATFSSVETAHVATTRLFGPASRGVTPQWRIGIAGERLPASQLAHEAIPGEVIIARDLHRMLLPRSRARYLPAEKVAGRDACRSMPPGIRRCFMITPLGEPNAPERAQSDWIFRNLVSPACARLVPRCLVVHPLEQIGSDIWADIANTLFSADHVIAYLGMPPWNPNVMVEVGYRLATGKPLVILAPRVNLPFDLSNRRTVMLPALPADPDEQPPMSEDDIRKSVDDIVRLMTERETQDIGWGGRPIATIAIDLREGTVKEHRVGDASPETAELFDLPRAQLIGMSPEDLIQHLGSLMDERQHEAFVEEQGRLYAQADALGAAKRPLYAEVPIFLTRHRDPWYFHRAFLPAVLMRERVEDWLLTKVVYIDVSRHLRVDCDGICRVPKPGPNLDLLFTRYAAAFDEVLPELPNYALTVETHCDLLAPGPERAILDLGAGTGNLTLRLLQKGAMVTAIDRNATMLEKLHEKCAEFDKNLQCYERDAADLALLESASFDAVNILLVLFAADQPGRILREAVRLLRPDGCLVITEPTRDFRLERVLEETEEELRRSGKLATLGPQWETVKRVNMAFRPALDEGWKVEQVKERLHDLGMLLIRQQKAYRGACMTLVWRRPASCPPVPR